MRTCAEIRQIARCHHCTVRTRQVRPLGLQLGAKGGSTSTFTVSWWINCLVGAWTWCTVLELPNLGRYFRVICYYGSIRAYETGFNYYYGQALHVESRVRGERQGGEGERSHWSSVTKCSRQLSRGICISFDTPYRITD